MSTTDHMPTVRVMKVLSTIADYDEGLTLTDIAEQTQISKGTLHPILATLVEHNYLSKTEENGHYRIGAECFKVGYSFVRNVNVMDVIKEKMDEIVHEFSEICQLGVFQNNEVFYISKSEPYRAIKLMSSIGRSLPAYASALGKALLSQLSNDEIRDLYKDGLKPLTGNTITDVEVLIKQIEKVRETRIATERGESSPDIECVAVPLRQDDTIFAAMSVSIPIYRSTPEQIEAIRKTLAEKRDEIENYIKTANIQFNLSDYYSK